MSVGTRVVSTRFTPKSLLGRALEAGTKWMTGRPVLVPFLGGRGHPRFVASWGHPITARRPTPQSSIESGQFVQPSYSSSLSEPAFSVTYFTAIGPGLGNDTMTRWVRLWRALQRTSTLACVTDSLRVTHGFHQRQGHLAHHNRPMAGYGTAGCWP